MPNGYRYPDTNDEIMTAGIEQWEPFPGYWNESARRGRDRLDRKLRTLLPSREAVNGLDAGCGWGRLLPWVAKFAARITAVDPDSHRIAQAKAQAPIADTAVQFEHGSIMDVDGGPYDLILCSHVVQHVPTTMVPRILKKLAEVSSSDGVLVLAFSRSPVDEESYGLSYLDDGRARVDTIDRARFDEVASRRENPGCVPFRRIDPDNLAIEARTAGWRLCWEWTYHIDNQPRSLYGRDQDDIINSSPDLARQSGGDIYTLWRPRS
ncbi:MAG: class I SAM-dependent methyltransferase [Alphaproteobacteria bacterium]|nr:class I SAM-dependent methyltransferase [Alphaproteobacteria bacterium]